MNIFQKTNCVFLQLTKPFFKSVTYFGIILLLLNSSTVCADVWDKWSGHAQEYEENEGVEEYVWKEGSNQLPDYPKDDDLLEASGPPNYKNYQYLIDGKNLNVGEDGVVRYSIVIRSPSGADNVMFDGIRCTSNEIKNYAYGSTDMDGKKKFIQRQNPVWKPVSSTGVTGYGPIFTENYFCNFEGSTLSYGEIIQNIKYGKGSVDGLYIK